MKEVYEYLNSEESAIKEEIENVLRQMCLGRSNREWSNNMIDSLYEQILDIMAVDLDGQHEDVGRLTVDTDMVITAMMMCLNNN